MIDLEALQVSDLDDLIVAANVTKESRAGELIARKAEIERQLSAARVERDLMYLDYTRNKIAPLLLESDKLRRQANLGFHAPSEAGRWLKNRKASLRRQLKRLGRSAHYYGKARELETSPEYRQPDPYQCYLHERRREVCKSCSRVVLPSDWNIASQLRFEIGNYPQHEPMLAIVGHTAQVTDEYFARLAAEDDDNNGNE